MNRFTPVASFAVLVFIASGCASQEVAFSVRGPSEVPASSTVVVRGSHGRLTEGVPLATGGDGGYSGTVALPPDEPVTYTFALRLENGDEVPEVSASWTPVPARALNLLDGGQYENVSAAVAHWELPHDPARPAVTFEVTIPAGSASTVWITGNVPELGAWSPQGLRLSQREDGKFVGRVFLPAGTTARYAVTRGTWSTMQVTANGSEVDLHTVTVGSDPQTATVAVERWLKSERSRLLTGTIEYLSGVASPNVNTRDVILWLPPGYHAAGNTTRYPVLYMHDGQNLMDGSTSFVGEWNIDELAQRLVKTGQLEPLIIVGVYNVGSTRITDYTPVPDPQYGGGGADRYAAFLVDELKPRIDAAYRTRTDAASTGVAGSSLGGLVSMWLGLTRSATFTRLGVVSPSVWWANRDIVGDVSELSAKPPLRIWLDIGTQEGSNAQRTVEDTRALRDALLAEGWSLGADLAYLEASGAGHNEAAWSARADLLLKYLYPPAP